MRVKSVSELQQGVVLSALEWGSNVFTGNISGAMAAFSSLMRNMMGLYGGSWLTRLQIRG